MTIAKKKTSASLLREPLAQGLWRDPPCSAIFIFYCSSNRIEVLNDSGKAKIGHLRVTNPIHKDIRLDKGQHRNTTDPHPSLTLLDHRGW
jgi:hypothetical protein